MFFPQACLVGYQNSGCEHKGDHSKEIPDPTGPMPIVPGPVAADEPMGGCRVCRYLPKLAVPYKGS